MQQFDARISAEAFALTQEYRTEGVTGVVQAVGERDRTPGALDYGLDDDAGAPIAGRLAGSRAPPGWSTMRLASAGGAKSIRVLTTQLPNGWRLRVGDDDARNDALERTVFAGFGWAFAGVVVLGALGGLGLSYAAHRRLASMSGAAEA